jgi:hypothetical protein
LDKKSRTSTSQGQPRPAGLPEAAAGSANVAPAATRPGRIGLGGRLIRVGGSFLIVLTAYVAYALAVVPLLEPAAERAVVETGPVDPKPEKSAREELVAAHFPAGSWELKHPKILESERAMLLIKDYQNLPDGRVKLQPCTVLFFGDEPARGERKLPPMIMQAPEGAILKFDEPFDLKRAKVGRLIGGVLVGKVTIRRELSRPGAADDMRVTTRDVELTEGQLSTPHPVDFHFGQSYGSGRVMNILLTRDDKPGGEKKGMGITGIKSFELVHDVRMHMLLGGKDPQLAVIGQKEDAPPRRPSEPPVEVTCQGPFHFDFDKSVATFSEQVDVLRLNANGPSDQMNCELLAIYFARREQASAATKAARPAAKAQPGGSGTLEARLVEARGEPVIIRSPSTGGQARCQRLEYDLKSGRVSLDGPGTLEGALPRNAAQKYQARWSKELRFEPQSTAPQTTISQSGAPAAGGQGNASRAAAAQPNGQPEGEQKISLLGDAYFRLTDVGTRAANGTPQPAALGADEIFVWLNPPPRASAGEATRSPLQANPLGQQTSGDDVRPKRILAQGGVRIDSMQLVGASGRLEVFFVPGLPAADGRSPRDPAKPPRAGEPAAAGPQRQYYVGGSQMRVQFAIRGDQTELSDVLLEGNAELRETKTAKQADKPLWARGDRLQLAGGDGPDSQVTVLGKPAHVEARGMALSGPNIQLERRTNRLWVDGPGRMALPLARDLSGRPLAAEQKLEINWQGRMNFDGHSAQFERTVEAHTNQQLLRTEKLEATLKQPIELAAAPLEGEKSQRTEIDQIVCREGVFMENRGFDPGGLASIDRMQSLDLAVNNTTGGVDAHGPGWVSSVRRGEPGAMLGPAGATAGKPAKQPPEKKPAEADTLTYLNVQFARLAVGNMHQRELTFTDQIKTIYGPVTGWEEKLDAEHPESLGPQGVTLNCDQLTVREMAGQVRASRADDGRPQRGFLELEALGSTLVEGTDFTARAHRLTFAEQKSLLVLEGDGRTDAQLFRQPTPGGPRSQAAARRIMFWPTTRRVEIDDARFFDLGQFNMGAKKPAAGAATGGQPASTGALAPATAVEPPPPATGRPVRSQRPGAK